MATDCELAAGMDSSSAVAAIDGVRNATDWAAGKVVPDAFLSASDDTDDRLAAADGDDYLAKLFRLINVTQWIAAVQHRRGID